MLDMEGGSQDTLESTLPAPERFNSAAAALAQMNEVDNEYDGSDTEDDTDTAARPQPFSQELCRRYWCVGRRYLERSDQLCPPRQRGGFFLIHQVIAERAYMKINTLHLSPQNSPLFAFTLMNL